MMGKTPRKRRTWVELALAGDRRLAEEVILEVRALAARAGIRVSEVTVARRGAPGKTSRRRTRASARVQ
jgi:hypothetical protein